MMPSGTCILVSDTVKANSLWNDMTGGDTCSDAIPQIKNIILFIYFLLEKGILIWCHVWSC